MVSKTYESLAQPPQPGMSARPAADHESTGPVASSTGQLTQMQQQETLTDRGPTNQPPAVEAPAPSAAPGPVAQAAPQHRFPTPFEMEPSPFKTY